MTPGGFRLPGTPASKRKRPPPLSRDSRPPTSSLPTPTSPSLQRAGAPPASSKTTRTRRQSPPPHLLIQTPPSPPSPTSLPTSPPHQPAGPPLVSSEQSSLDRPSLSLSVRPMITGKFGKRNPLAGLSVDYADHAKLDEELKELTRVHLRPIVELTKQKYFRARLLWIQYFTFKLESEELAQATLIDGATFPPIEQVKHFIRYCAITGKSRFKGKKGWSMTTTKNFWGSVVGMRARHRTVPLTEVQMHDVLNMLSSEAKEKKNLTTLKKDKRIVREADLIEFQAATLDVRFPVASRYVRLEIGAFGNVLFTTAIRPGTGLEITAYIYSEREMRH
ncbi:hypothetical protein BDZ97DRAFT_1008063 [Flammula alnicola]|nr:hypothetical protein BDZ97DRAFT_1008063 [Flammula alnicola]